jgi:hypothetical protein
MTIMTKFNVGDHVFCILGDRVQRGQIERVMVLVLVQDSTGGRPVEIITYKFVNEQIRSLDLLESRLFASKEELLKSL